MLFVDQYYVDIVGLVFLYLQWCCVEYFVFGCVVWVVVEDWQWFIVQQCMYWCQIYVVVFEMIVWCIVVEDVVLVIEQVYFYVWIDCYQFVEQCVYFVVMYVVCIYQFVVVCDVFGQVV